MPKVSIIMGAYNGAKKLPKSIESIIQQSFKDWELIICNDGSTDNSTDVIRQFTVKDHRIILVENENNQGLAKTLNHCLEVAQGEYIARMDDDDYSHPQRLELEVDFLDNHPEYDIVATGRNMVDEDGIWGRDVSPGERTGVDIFTGRFFAHPTVMIRRTAYQKVGGYSTYPGIGREEDTDLWCKLYVAGSKGYVLDNILLDYYESRNSMSRRKFRYRISECKIKLKYRKQLGVPFAMSIYAFKPILAGFIPNKVIELYHHYKYYR